LKVKLADENPLSEAWYPEKKPDGSQIGINFVDAYIKPFNKQVGEGVAVSCKRRGLKLTVKVGSNKGEALLRRLDNGPDVKKIMTCALTDAFAAAGAVYSLEEKTAYLDI